MIENILSRKIHGIDCTEEESAEIKGYIRENLQTRPDLWHDVVNYFPLEFDEVLAEEIQEK